MKGSKWAPQPSQSAATSDYDPFAKLSSALHRLPKRTTTAKSNAIPIRDPADLADGQSGLALAHGHGQQSLDSSDRSKDGAQPSTRSILSSFDVNRPVLERPPQGARMTTVQPATKQEKLSFINSRPVQGSPTLSFPVKTANFTFPNASETALRPVDRVEKPGISAPQSHEQRSVAEAETTEPAHAPAMAFSATKIPDREATETEKMIAEMEAEEKRLAEKKRILTAKLEAESKAKRHQAEDEAGTESSDPTKAAIKHQKKLQIEPERLSPAISAPTHATMPYERPTKAEKLAFITSRPFNEDAVPRYDTEKASLLSSQATWNTIKQSIDTASQSLNSTSALADGKNKLIVTAKSLDATESAPSLTLSSEHERIRQMVAEMAVEDRKRALEKVQQHDTTAQVLKHGSPSLVAAGPEVSSLDLSRKTILPLDSGLSKPLVAGADGDSYQKARHKLHARPDAPAMDDRTEPRMSPPIASRQSSLTPPQNKLPSRMPTASSTATQQSPTETAKPVTKSLVRENAPIDKQQSAEKEVGRVQQGLAELTLGPTATNTKQPDKSIASTNTNVLPVDKLAFTLRSSSLEKENHPARMTVPNKDPLATAFAAMNEIDRLEVSMQDEFIFKSWPEPAKRPPIFVRRVHLSGLPKEYTAAQVLSLIWGGRIERLDYKVGSGEATALFMRYEDCLRYYADACNGVDIPGHANKWAMVKLADRPEAAHEFLRGLIAGNATRCIRAIGVDAGLGMGALVKLASNGKREVERLINGTNPKGLRIVEFRFLNVYDGMRFKSEIEKLEDWEACNVFCASDPCAKANCVHPGLHI